MATYSYTKTVNVNKLYRELGDSSIKPLITNLVIIIDQITIETSVVLDVAGQAELDGIIANHTSDDNYYTIQLKIEKAIEFGNELISQYAAQNILAGFTVSDVLQVMTALDSVKNALSAGSLYVALDQLALVTPTTLITQADIDKFRHRIQDYLGVTRT